MLFLSSSGKLVVKIVFDLNIIIINVKNSQEELMTAKIIIIGAGASGLAAAIAAGRIFKETGAEEDNPVILLERMSSAGEKDTGNRKRPMQFYKQKHVSRLLSFRYASTIF